MTDTQQTTSTGLSLIDQNEDKNNRLNIDLKLLQIRDIGIRITLQGVAETHAKRLAKLTNMAIALEDEIFDEDLIDILTESEKVKRYELLLNSINNHSNAVRSTLGGIDWSSLEVKLQSIGSSIDSGSDVNDKQQLSKLASNLLAELNIINSK